MKLFIDLTIEQYACTKDTFDCDLMYIFHEDIDGISNHKISHRYMTTIPRSASQGGGVLIAVRSNINCEPYTNHLMTDLEAIRVRIPATWGTFIFTVCTFSPQQILRFIVAMWKQ